MDKSGGEWISSIEIESAVNHEDIAEAAVIGRYHPMDGTTLADLRLTGREVSEL